MGSRGGKSELLVQVGEVSLSTYGASRGGKSVNLWCK